MTLTFSRASCPLDARRRGSWQATTGMAYPRPTRRLASLSLSRNDYARELGCYGGCYGWKALRLSVTV
jgi:hypothetical protein